MFSVRRERGRLAELAPVVRVLAATPSARAMATRSGRAARRARHGGRGAARARTRAGDGLDPFRASLWLTSLVYLTDAAAALGDAEAAALLYPELAPFAGGERDDRAPRLLLRRRRPLSRHARRDARRGRPGRARTSSAALELNRAMGAETWLAHTAYEYGRLLLLPARRHRAARRPARGGRGARPADRDAGAARPGRRPGRTARRARCRTASPRARPRSSGSSARASAIASSARRCRSASTRPRTTSAASCARPAARTAPRRRPMPTAVGAA